MFEPTDQFSERIVDSLHEPLLVLDEDLRVRRANPSFCRTFGMDEEEVLGEELFDVGNGAWELAGLRRALGRVVEEDESFEGLEVEDTFPGYGRRVLRLNGRTLPQENGDSRHVLLAIEDITEQRRLEEDLREHSRQLERSNADLEQFAYAASHDLQEPLRMISSYLQLLERRYGDELEGEAREFIDYAVDGAERMKALINGLLQYSRVGRKEGEFGPVDLDAVLDDVLEDLARRIEELGGTVDREPLPTVHGNRDQLRRLVQNLIENALTYRGDGPPRIRVTAEPDEEAAAHLVVADRGPGIPEEFRTRVFQIFQQLDPHGQGREGSGMGLALCRKIVERHDGRIWVESGPGGGSAFHVTLDLQHDDGKRGG